MSVDRRVKFEVNENGELSETGPNTTKVTYSASDTRLLLLLLESEMESILEHAAIEEKSGLIPEQKITLV